MNADVIKDFLISLGFQVDDSGAKKFDATLASVTLNAVKAGAAIEATALSVVAFTAKIASGLDNLYWMSQRTGATVAGIQQIGYAVSQLGGTVEGARGALEGLSRFMRNNPGAEGFLNRLGVQTRDAKGNMRDMASVFTSVGDKLRDMPYYRANMYAQMLGIDENTLMAMRRGVGQFSAQYSQMTKAIGYNADVAAVSSNRFMTSLRSFGQMAGMARDKIGSNLADGLAGSIDNLRRQILDNFPKIEGALTSGIKFILALGDGIGQLLFRLMQGASDLREWWGTLDNSTRDLIELIGGLTLAWWALNRAMYASPITWVLGLVAAVALLWDDYKTWKEGGKSFIDWGKWKPEIDAAVKGVNGFISSIKDVSLQAAKLFGIDPKTWSLKFEFTDAMRNLRDLGKMLSLIADLLNAVNEGRWSDVVSIGKQILSQHSSKPDALPGVSSSANSVAGWIKDKTGFDPRSIGQTVTGWFGGDDTAGLPAGELKRGERNNNPGNLNFVGQRGAELEGPGGRFAKFRTAYDGLEAMAKQLLRYASRGINSVEGIISTWAPGNENDTASYIKAITSSLGVSPDAALNMQNPQVLSQLMNGIIHHENGRNIYSGDLISRAASGAVSPSVSMETNINIHGVSDPREAGNVVAEKQNQVSARATQQLSRGNG